MGGRSSASEKNYIPDDVEFQTKPEIAIDLIDRAVRTGIKVAVWTFDELYGRDHKFLDALSERGEAFVAEIPSDMRLWTNKPRVVRKAKRGVGRGRPTKVPYVSKQRPPCKVCNLATYSEKFTQQSWQRYRIKDTERGPEVCEVKWLLVWRQSEGGFPSRQQTLIVTRNVRTGEMKYFLSNQVIGRRRVTLRQLLRVAFGRWAIEACFRVSKEELGLDHFEVRGWQCIHRHYYLTGLSSLLCARIRTSLEKGSPERLSVEQVRRALNCYLFNHNLPPDLLNEAFEKELEDQAYYQRRNATAKRSHTKTRIALYASLGIDVERIKSCIL